jgi:hypothetical protein
VGRPLSAQPPPWVELIPLLGDRAMVMHAPPMSDRENGLSGLDIDCAVERLDPMWPLRRPDGWRLCQVLRYDLSGWYWVLERDGQVYALDTIDDPWGLGRDAIRTGALFDGSDAALGPASRAAYLAIKRVRKRNFDEGEWAWIGTLASEDPEGLAMALRRISGRRLGDVLEPIALAGVPPSPASVQRANLIPLRTSFGTPARIARALSLASSRYAQRIAHPAGFVVQIVGPDGAGKTKLAEALPREVEGLFRTTRHIHWRPGLLPRPGSFLGRRASDPSAPHVRQPFGRLLSLGLLGYYWADFFFGRWLVEFRLRVRTGFVLIERGWWDLLVDPRRYRLQPPPSVTSALARVLRTPDLTIVLDAPGSVFHARKQELPPEELDRQTRAWRTALPERAPRLDVDASRPFDEITREVRGAILRALEARATSRLGAGWASLPMGSGRWWFPRAPRGSATAALMLHQPATLQGIAAWHTARTVARLDGFRLLRRRSAPPLEVRAALATHVPPRGTIAVARANHPGRYIAALLDERGIPRGIAKVVADDEGEDRLEGEVGALKELGPSLDPPLSCPRVLHREPGLLILEPITWSPRLRPWELPGEVAAGMGAFFRAGSGGEQDPTSGPAHGDLAPWNLLRTRDGWTLVDWESAREDAPPFHDLCHFFVQAHSLLGRPSERAVVDGFERGAGVVGTAVRSYAEAARLPLRDAGPALASYLRVTTPGVRTMTPSEQRGLERRGLLLDRLGG